MIARKGIAQTITMASERSWNVTEGTFMAGKVTSKEPKLVQNTGVDSGDHYPPDPYPDYRPVYGWVFQAWLVMFLTVICLALVFYLLSYVPW
jgi:hypothetical protein